ncbi:MAG: hypothetical protein HY545_02140, partial [Candidatus Doudnabacteria bacterium]|nr:hypothetical protein [Candidatus Doudnabacteria bacterium]
AFVELEDLGGSMEVLVFPGTFQKYKDIVMEEKIVIVSGRVSDKDGVPKFLADEIKELNNSPISPTSHTITVRVPDNASEELFMELKKLFELFPGSMAVDLLVNEQRVKTPYRINLTEELKNQLQQFQSSYIIN